LDVIVLGGCVFFSFSSPVNVWKLIEMKYFIFERNVEALDRCKK